MTGFFHLPFRDSIMLYVACVRTSFLLLLNNIPLCIPYYVYLFISWWTCGLFPLFWLLWIMLLWIFVYKLLCEHVFISLGYIPRSRISKSYGNSMFNILRNCQTVFPKWLHRFTMAPALFEGCSFSTSSPAFVIAFYLSGNEVVSHCGFYFSND